MTPTQMREYITETHGDATPIADWQLSRTVDKILSDLYKQGGKRGNGEVYPNNPETRDILLRAGNLMINKELGRRFLMRMKGIA